MDTTCGVCRLVQNLIGGCSAFSCLTDQDILGIYGVGQGVNHFIVIVENLYFDLY